MTQNPKPRGRPGSRQAGTAIALDHFKRHDKLPSRTALAKAIREQTGIHPSAGTTSSVLTEAAALCCVTDPMAPPNCPDALTEVGVAHQHAVYAAGFRAGAMWQHVHQRGEEAEAQAVENENAETRTADVEQLTQKIASLTRTLETVQTNLKSAVDTLRSAEQSREVRDRSHAQVVEQLNAEIRNIKEQRHAAMSLASASNAAVITANKTAELANQRADHVEAEKRALLDRIARLQGPKLITPAAATESADAGAASSSAGAAP